ncbi:hypothetical protein F5Y15DRAFT_145830 [Xylariaceae sp. FL0016]|nr:hypothetical protein F5Y15DRAFT_145830 [Xylariaceae sp. FL0016]
MKTGFISRLLVSMTLICFCRADLLEYADDLPKCALDCIVGLIPTSVCETFTNSTCICTDTGLYDETLACVSKTCSVEDQLTMARLYQEACDKPTRSRRGDIPGFAVLCAFALGCIAVRLYVRYTTALKVEMDDIVLVLMLLVFVGFEALGKYVRYSVIGYDIWTLDPDLITSALQMFFIEELLYTAVLALCRVGILSFLLRVFSSVHAFKRVCYLIMSWVVVTAVVIIFMTAFQCWPVQYNWLGWKGDFGEQKCIDVNVLSFVAAGMGIAQDLIILLVPLPIIMQLEMPLQRKLFTFLMFSLGACVTVISCLRLRYLVQFAKSTNPTYDYTDAVIWTDAEVLVSVVVLCLPSLRILLGRVLPRVFGSQMFRTPPLDSRRTSRGRIKSYKDITKQSTGLSSRTETQGETIELPIRIVLQQQKS